MEFENFNRQNFKYYVEFSHKHENLYCRGVKKYPKQALHVSSGITISGEFQPDIR